MAARVPWRTGQRLRSAIPIQLPTTNAIIQASRQPHQPLTGPCPVTAGLQLQPQLQLQQSHSLPQRLGLRGLLQGLLQQLIRLGRIHIGHVLGRAAQTLGSLPAAGTPLQQHGRRSQWLFGCRLVVRELVQSIALTHQDLLLKGLDVAVHQSPQGQGRSGVIQSRSGSLPAQQQPVTPLALCGSIATQHTKGAVRGTAVDQSPSTGQHRGETVGATTAVQQLIAKKLLLGHITLLPGSQTGLLQRRRVSG